MLDADEAIDRKDHAAIRQALARTGIHGWMLPIRNHLRSGASAGAGGEAKPTDGLWGDDRSDEDQLGASYPELEWAMALRERGTDPATLGLTARQRSVLAIYDQRNAANRHKMEPIPVGVVPSSLTS